VFDFWIKKKLPTGIFIKPFFKIVSIFSGSSLFANNPNVKFEF